MDFAAAFKHQVTRVETGLDRYVPAATTRPTRLHEAMRYSLLGGGKRLRPVLTLATAKALGLTNDSALPAAVAIECLHTYSLIHDDLPCMDNDDLRRGRPTVHRQFDEATALLAGDALLTEAFVILSVHYASRPTLAQALTRELADAASSRRLIGGQMEDLLAEKKSTATAKELEFIHLNKTAAMIEAAFVMGGLCAEGPQSALSVLRTVGHHVGLAFQIIDDVLDATADTATLGKTAGKDAKADKTTFVKLHGIETSRRLAHEHGQAAQSTLRSLPGDAAFLHALIESMAARIN
ncbi:MAG: polyprenyl synthetase family protein [Opitutaceae bacterium]|nr:polyprenyl synthetase family protein [Opitutaceae bacterium]